MRPNTRIEPSRNRRESSSADSDLELNRNTTVSTMLKMVHGIRAGTVWVNSYGVIDPNVGFGGVKMSGYGSKGSAAHIDAYLYQKAVYINGG